MHQMLNLKKGENKMNKKLITVAAGLGLTISFGVAPVAFAAPASDATSNNHIAFEADESITTPVDPTDPDNPNPPDPVDPTDPENPGTGNSGPLSIDYVSNIEFGTQKISSNTVTYRAQNENPFVQVTDNRGTGAGWTLTAKASEFKSADGTKVLKGALLSFKNGQAKTQSANISAAPETKDVAFNNTDAKVMMNAKKETGRGTWVDVFSGTVGENENVTLQVLPGTADADVDYTATINWELTDAPLS